VRSTHKVMLVSMLVALSLTACSAQLEGTQTSVAVSPMATVSILEAVMSSPLPEGEGVDCRKLAFNSERTGVYQVYVYDVAEDKLSLVTDLHGRSVEPDWSPDGQHIVFSTTSDTGASTELAVVGADGSGMRVLTSLNVFAQSADWSPDGECIAFHSNVGGNFDIFIIDSEGQGLTNLTNHEAGDFMPSWSPSGEEIAFVSTRAGGFDIFRMDVGNVNALQLTTDQSYDYYSPDWSPDGGQIVFVGRSYDGNEEIFVIGVDGTGQRRLTDPDSNNSSPVWSVNGEHIIFASDRDGSWQLYSMRRDGSDQKLVSNQTQGRDPACW